MSTKVRTSFNLFRHVLLVQNKGIKIDGKVTGWPLHFKSSSYSSKTNDVFSSSGSGLESDIFGKRLLTVTLVI